MWRGVASAEITIKSRSALTTLGLTADPIAITARKLSLAGAEFRNSQVHFRALSVGQRSTWAGESPHRFRRLRPIVGSPFNEISDASTYLSISDATSSGFRSGAG